MDFTADLPLLFAETGVDLTLWPDTDHEQFLERGGLYGSPYELVDVGGRVSHMSLSPSVAMLSANADDLRQGDAILVHPSAALAVPGGYYTVATIQPDGTGMTLVELKKSGTRYHAPLAADNTRLVTVGGDDILVTA